MTDDEFRSREEKIKTLTAQIRYQVDELVKDGILYREDLLAEESFGLPAIKELVSHIENIMSEIVELEGFPNQSGD